ncbi:MAG: phenol hydroxylase P0 protein [Gammaproteobacteria bacterium]|jgi:phenol hydroxylase P0 protein
MGSLTSLKAISEDGVHYVRITNHDHRGNVEFQYSISDPSLFLEMILPKTAFELFCRERNARVLSDAEGQAVDESERRWQTGDEEEE